MRASLSRISLGLVSMLFLVAGLHGSAQAPANLSGTWVFATQRDFNPSLGPRSNFGLEFQVRHDAASLTIERAAGTQKAVTVHPLDGSETETKTGQAVTKYRARAQDGKIVLDVTNTSAPGPDGKPVTTISTRTLWREGDDLISEWIITSPTQSTSVSVYRQPPPGPSPSVQPAQATLAAISWLSGNWEGRVGTTSLEERWTPAAGGAMLAVSRTVSGNKMVAFEFLRIVERDGTLVYVAQPNGRAPATEFTLTRIGATEAVFENPAHDFPKMITYRLAADGTLTAVIADIAGLKPQHFVFKKAQTAGLR